MDTVKSSFFSTTSPLLPCSHPKPKRHNKRPKLPSTTFKNPILSSSIHPDPWSPRDGDISKPKPRSKNPKNPLSDDNARRIIKKKAQYLGALRRNQGPQAMTPKWIKRTPEQMVQYLQDDRHGHLYGKHVVAAIKTVRGLAAKREGECDIRMVMASFVGKLSFRDMCVVLKEQKGWRQLSYRPSVIVYTILLRAYGQVGKIKLAEQIFLEMLEMGCEPDEVACGTMLCAYARWGRHKAMMSFYSAVKERGIILSVPVFNFMLSSLQKRSFHENVIDLWRQMLDKEVAPNHFTYSVVISSLVKSGHHEEVLKTFNEMKNLGFVPEEGTYSLLISSSMKSGKWEEALSLYDDMRCRGIIPSNYTCASLLTLYYKTEDYSKALSLFSEMERNKIAADEVIYGLLIRLYGKLGLYEDAEKTFEETKQLGLLSDEKTYLAMTQVYLNSGNVEKALNVIDAMKSRNIWFSRFAYIVLLQCFVMKEDLGSAEDTFQTLSNSGLPDAAACNDMLKLYLKLDLTEKAKDFIIQIRKDQVDFDEDLFRTVMRVYCKEGMLRDAKQLIEEMGKNEAVKDNKFIQTFLKAMNGEYQIDEKSVSSYHPENMALGLLLTLYLSDGNFGKVEEILKLLTETAGGLPVVNQLARKFIREGDVSKAETLNYQIIKLGFRLEDEALASLIGLYGNQRKLKMAQGVFMAVADSPASGKLIFNSMIDAYVKCGKPEEAYLLYKEATDRGHDLGVVAVSIVVNALTNFGMNIERFSISVPFLNF